MMIGYDEQRRVVGVGHKLVLVNITRDSDDVFECHAENGVPPTARKTFHVTVECKHILTIYSAEAIIVLHRIIWSWYTGRWRVGCYIWYSEEGLGGAAARPGTFHAVPNVTARPSAASVYQSPCCCINGPLLCGLMCPFKG